MSSPANVLLIEDDASAASALRRVLADEGYHVTVVGRAKPDGAADDLREDAFEVCG